MFTSMYKARFGHQTANPTVARVATLHKEQHKARGLGGVELAKVPAIPVHGSARIETGHRHPDLYTIIQRAVALDRKMGFTILAPISQPHHRSTISPTAEPPAGPLLERIHRPTRRSAGSTPPDLGRRRRTPIGMAVSSTNASHAQRSSENPELAEVCAL